MTDAANDSSNTNSNTTAASPATSSSSPGTPLPLPFSQPAVEPSLLSPPTGLSQRAKIAWGVAVGVDLLQMVLLPAFAPGFLSPLNLTIDTATAVAMVWLLGWHPAFLPTFALENIPMIEVAPTWTVAVLIATKAWPTKLAREPISTR